MRHEAQSHTDIPILAVGIMEGLHAVEVDDLPAVRVWPQCGAVEHFSHTFDGHTVKVVAVEVPAPSNIQSISEPPTSEISVSYGVNKSHSFNFKTL